MKIINFNLHIRSSRITAFRHSFCPLDYNMCLTYNNQSLCDNSGLRIHLHTDFHKQVGSTPCYISPLSLPQALHTAASELPQKPDTLVRHSTPLIRTLWPSIVMLVILDPFIQLLSTCSFNQTPPLMTQLHINQYVHAG